MVSARHVFSAARAILPGEDDREGRNGVRTWMIELIWREFFQAILYHFPHVRRESFRTATRNVAWRNSRSDFDAWCMGRTGYPVVDACMRQLTETGWMHNRGRMIVASFLVKDLLVDWRWGERWFMQHLLDGDPAANNGGWQWSAGTGTDAAPYFRIFNPVLQSKKFDPQATFIRRWIPELSSLPDAYIHEPWRMPPERQVECGCIIGETYPGPIVDHREARERTLQAYAQAKTDRR
jgi:deoxyribodipyrimidine photo-lyase